MPKLRRYALLLTVGVWIVVALLWMVRVASAADLTLITETAGHSGLLVDLGTVAVYSDARGTTGTVLHEPMFDLWQLRTEDGVSRQGMVLPLSPVDDALVLSTPRPALPLVPFLAFPSLLCSACDEEGQP